MFPDYHQLPMCARLHVSLPRLRPLADEDGNELQLCSSEVIIAADFSESSSWHEMFIINHHQEDGVTTCILFTKRRNLQAVDRSLLEGDLCCQTVFTIILNCFRCIVSVMSLIISDLKKTMHPWLTVIRSNGCQKCTIVLIFHLALVEWKLRD